MSTPVHIVAGFLGAGKTTTIRAWMEQNAGRERAAVIVNDFGEAGIDGALLAAALPGDIPVVNIPGGCVCCTAPAGLAQAVATVLDTVRPDRVFIEPSGLARPQDVVDMLSRGPLRARVALGPTIVVVDPTLLAADGPPAALLDTQLEAADVLVLNRVDLAEAGVLAAFRARVASLWPGPARVLETTWGRLPADALDWPEGAGPRVRYTAVTDAPSTDGYRARSWVFPPEARFAWDALRALLSGTPGIARFKGLLAADVGWSRVDVAGGRVQLAGTAWRRDSRADVIVTAEVDLDAFAAAFAACVLPEGAAPAGAGVTLVGADGAPLLLGRDALAALPAQVPDVAAHVPGRTGVAVPLAEVLALAHPGPGARFVVVASDGMTTEPALVAGVDGAYLVHTVADGPVPADQGGPFRLLVRPGAPKSACAAVKGVVRIRVLAGE
jgi:G3E family GTPase